MNPSLKTPKISLREKIKDGVDELTASRECKCSFN